MAIRIDRFTLIPKIEMDGFGLRDGKHEWSADLCNQPNPIKVTDNQLMWSVARYVFMVSYEYDRADFQFGDDFVTVSVPSGSGNRCHWIFRKI